MIYIVPFYCSFDKKNLWKHYTNTLKSDFSPHLDSSTGKESLIKNVGVDITRLPTENMENMQLYYCCIAEESTGNNILALYQNALLFPFQGD